MELQPDVVTLCRSLGIGADAMPDFTKPLVKLIGGLTLNGRKLSQGDTCEYLPIVSDSQPAEYRLGVINMFYKFATSSNTDGYQILVDITQKPVLSKVRSLYVVAREARDTQLKRFTHTYTRSTHALIHIDWITHKIFLAPHFDEALRATQMCGIPMWEMR